MSAQVVKSQVHQVSNLEKAISLRSGQSARKQLRARVEFPRNRPPARPVPAVLTCGTAEENRANNQLMAATLCRQGYPAALHEVPDAHNYVAWRDAFDPHLVELLTEVWGDG